MMKSIFKKWIKDLIESQLNQMLKKKLGYDIRFKVSEVNVSINGEKASIHLDMDADMDSAEFLKMGKEIALHKIKG